MTSFNPPRPLIQSGSPRLRAALHQAQQSGPSDAEIQRLIERVATTVGAGGALLHDAAGAPTELRDSSADGRLAFLATLARHKWPLLCIVAAAAGFIGWKLGATTSETAFDASTMPSPTVPARAPAQPAGAATRDRPDSVADNPVANEPASAAEERPVRAPVSHEPRRKRPRPKPSMAPWTDDSAAENALIEPALRDLRARRFDAVLERVGVHEQRFPAGGLSQPRELLRIEALIALGVHEAALQHIERFRSRFPRSLYLTKLAQLTAALPNATGVPSTIDAEVIP